MSADLDDFFRPRLSVNLRLVAGLVNRRADEPVAVVKLSRKHNRDGSLVDMSAIPDVVNVNFRLNFFDEFRTHGVNVPVVIRLADADFARRAPNDPFQPDVRAVVVENRPADVAAGEESELPVRHPNRDAEQVLVGAFLVVARILHKQILRRNLNVRVELVFRLGRFQTDGSVPADIENLEESFVLFRVFFQGDLIRPPDDKRRSLESVRLFLILNELHPVRGFVLTPGCNRSVVVRIRAVENLVKMNVFRHLRQAGKMVVFPAAGGHAGVVLVVPAAMVVVEMRAHHIVDVVARRVDPLDVPRHPFACAAAVVRQNSRCARTRPVAGVEQHGRPVRINMKRRFRRTRIDKVQVEFAFFPARVRLAGFRTVRRRRFGNSVLSVTGLA